MVDEHIVGISRLSHADGPQRNVLGGFTCYGKWDIRGSF